MRIALLGASGFIGREFVAQSQARGHGAIPIRRCECDIYSVSALTRFLESESPDVLINCAGYTGKPNVDACESDKASCLASNAVLPGIVREACHGAKIPWGHVSSACIYSGRRPDGQGFRETDPPNFSFRQNHCSWYSGTKALGEEVLAGAADCYIWRLRIPFSNRDCGRNYLSKLQRFERLLEAENSLSSLPEFVAACLDCFERGVSYGTYNLTNPGSIRTSEVVELIRRSGVCQKRFRFFESEDEFMREAVTTPRSNCVIDSTKALQAGLHLTPLRDAIEDALATWQFEPSPLFSNDGTTAHDRA